MIGRDRAAIAAPRRALRLAVLWLAGADLRLTVLAVPPVLPLIHRQFALSERAVGALSGLPVALFGLAAVLGSLLIARLGARRAAIVGLTIVAFTSAMRGLGPSLPMLFMMTFVMAAGVAIVQPALPALVAQWFADRAGFATAVYANGLLIGEALPAALTIPLVLPLVGGSWPASFVVWSVPAAAAALLLGWCGEGALSGRVKSLAGASARWWPDWRRRETWQLGLMVGGTGGLYFSSNALIPDYLHALGRPEWVTAGLSALNVGQLPASLLLLLAAQRLGLSKAAIVVVQVVAFAGIAALFTGDPPLVVGGAGVIGFCCAFVLITSLALPPQLVGVTEVHHLSAGMFAIGYTLSSVVPFIGGAVWDATGDPRAGFLVPAAAAAIVLGAVLSFHFPRRTDASGCPHPGASATP